jgi:hypothetical protein
MSHIDLRNPERVGMFATDLSNLPTVPRYLFKNISYYVSPKLDLIVARRVGIKSSILNPYLSSLKSSLNFQVKENLDAGDALLEFTPNWNLINLVIANDLDFENAKEVLLHRIPIVVPEWVFRSVRFKELLNVENFSADPAKLFSAVNLYIDPVGELE